MTSEERFEINPNKTVRGEEINDKARFNRFLEILPEQKVYAFLDELTEGTYRDIYNKMLADYEKYLEMVFSSFRCKEINKVFEEFNGVFKLLHSFLLAHFFRIRPEEEFIALYPEMRHSSDKEKEGLWMNRFEELQSMVSNFNKQYRNFLKVGYKKFSDVSNKKWGGVFNE